MLYPGVVYGPGDLTDGEPRGSSMVARPPAPASCPRSSGPGDRLWSYAYVDDVAEGHAAALERGRRGRALLPLRRERDAEPALRARARGDGGARRRAGTSLTRWRAPSDGRCASGPSSPGLAPQLTHEVVGRLPRALGVLEREGGARARLSRARRSRRRSAATTVDWLRDEGAPPDAASHRGELAPQDATWPLRGLRFPAAHPSPGPGRGHGRGAFVFNWQSCPDRRARGSGAAPKLGPGLPAGASCSIPLAVLGPHPLFGNASLDGGRPLGRPRLRRRHGHRGRVRRFGGPRLPWNQGKAGRASSPSSSSAPWGAAVLMAWTRACPSSCLLARSPHARGSPRGHPRLRPRRVAAHHPGRQPHGASRPAPLPCPSSPRPIRGLPPPTPPRRARALCRPRP